MKRSGSSEMVNPSRTRQSRVNQEPDNRANNSVTNTNTVHYNNRRHKHFTPPRSTLRAEQTQLNKQIDCQHIVGQLQIITNKLYTKCGKEEKKMSNYRKGKKVNTDLELWR
ncbi:hypothetical protein E2C01_046751 [Portunus trituberculatus]|uniref:Uncharacterized protein n=1 Tax=Portunus trituberculatus TaxID=210409 RepID=A0A5B7G1S8_PORTR|nr:hypothetical protein [Portunus trituberculatus]